MAGGDAGELFPGFEALWIETSSGRWFAHAGGREEAPALLLLHGFPQTHAMWHRIAPALAQDRRVICLDLKGYGWSDAPKGEPDHSTYAKRTHIVPGAIQWERIAAHPEMNPHWPFLAKPAPEPEREIGQDPDAYYQGLLRRWTNRDDLSAFDPRALHLYRQSWNVPERIHAMCEDYRAGGPDGPDRAADMVDLEAGRTLSMPVLVLASRDYLDRGKPESALAVWQRTFAPKAEGVSIAGGHFLAEEKPQDVLTALQKFLRI